MYSKAFLALLVDGGGGTEVNRTRGKCCPSLSMLCVESETILYGAELMPHLFRSINDIGGMFAG